MKRPLKQMSLAVFGRCALWLLVGLAATNAHASEPFSGRVVGIADGDTLTVLADTTPHKIRLAEIDAPEKRQDFGERARQSLAALCFDQQAEVSKGKTDRYGRTVARVSCRGIDASLHQVLMGLAWAYTAYLTDPVIAIAEQAARDSRTGLWADVEPTPPWLYRKGKRQ
jgi:endonuclease YncB( thermonuclease family)